MARVDLAKNQPLERDPGVWFQKWRPGQSAEQLIRIAEAGARGFILEAFHSGTLPTAERIPPQYNALTFLRHTQREGIPVFMIFAESITDPNLEFGYKPFDDGIPGAYVSTRPAIALGLVPLRASTPQAEQVIRSLGQILVETRELESIENRMYALFQFRTPLAQLRAALDAS